MSIKVGQDLVKRWEENPIITPADIPFPCNTVFNATAAKFSAEYILLLRVEDLARHSIFALARSEDGFHFKVDDEPVMTPSTEGDFGVYEQKGIEDPRITLLEGIYYIVYTAASDYGPRLALAKTADFKNFERVALISEPDNKDGALFPRKIGGRYARLDRPMVGGQGNIWISYSHDLIHWGGSRMVMRVRNDFWDSWRVGDIPNVVFSSGAILEEDHQIKIYYGAADTCICIGTAHIDELMQFCTIGEDR